MQKQIEAYLIKYTKLLKLKKISFGKSKKGKTTNIINLTNG